MHIEVDNSTHYSHSSAQEDTAILKRKVERLKKIEMASDMDEILKEEIREYKETLTCPSCKVTSSTLAEFSP